MSGKMEKIVRSVFGGMFWTLRTLCVPPMLIGVRREQHKSTIETCQACQPVD